MDQRGTLTDDVQPFGYSVKQASEITPFSESYLRNEIRAGNLKAKLKGRRVVITSAALAEWLQDAPDWTPSKERELAAAA